MKDGSNLFCHRPFVVDRTVMKRNVFLCGVCVFFECVMCVCFLTLSLFYGPPFQFSALTLPLFPLSHFQLEGACEGVCACSTCHCILSSYLFDKLEDEGKGASEDEEDMLDMAFGLEENSRLGCQIILTKEMDGEVFRQPFATRNFYVDGHVPKPH